ncbi:protein FMP42 [Cyclospora cayetanensis]|uniref:Major facilitator family protein n=2 Tax=Cyclospora cayetanensis TaxID=88456 RepID=A0A1D3D703_9EIME|nr:protein FMP42 [Cyclospora cayetanensis]OEH79226.1 major facilitator family protein [Cyclospora cayetanensis]
MDQLTETGAPVKPPKRVAGSQPRIHPYLLICILCLYCLLAGPVYFNWTPIADSLFQSNAFLWRCTPDELAGPSPAHSYSPRCAAQELAVNSLFMVASSSHFFCSFLGGLFLDLLGPCITGMVGTGIMLIGWVLLATSSQAFNAYTFAAVLIGMSVDMAFFPCLSAANLFPKNGSTVIAILGCFRSLSFVVPLGIRAAVVQYGVGSSMQALLVYAGLFLSLCFLVAVFLLPSKPFSTPQEQQEEQMHQKPQALTDSSTSDHREGSDRTESAVDGGAVRNRQSFMERASMRLYSFRAECCSAAYLPLLLLFSFLLTNIIFFVPSASHLLPAAYVANQVIQTFSFLPCPFLGMLADKVGILPVMHLTNLCGLLCYVCTVVPGIPAATVLQYLASILFAVQVSFFMSQLYCYASVTFSQENLGKLVGLVCATAGLVSLVSGPMRAYALDNGFLPMCLVAISLATCNVAILVFLHVVQYRKQKRERSNKTKVAAGDLEAATQ